MLAIFKFYAKKDQPGHQARRFPHRHLVGKAVDVPGVMRRQYRPFRQCGSKWSSPSSARREVERHATSSNSKSTRSPICWRFRAAVPTRLWMCQMGGSDRGHGSDGEMVVSDSFVTAVEAAAAPTILHQSDPAWCIVGGSGGGVGEGREEGVMGGSRERKWATTRVSPDVASCSRRRRCLWRAGRLEPTPQEVLRPPRVFFRFASVVHRQGS